MKVSIKGFITCKSAEYFIDCADNYALNKSNHRFSVSDGVSKSFFPKVWSEILVTQFVKRTDLKEKDFIKFCQEEWQKRIDEIVSLPDTKWFTKAQYSRKDPALATFVGLEFFEKEKQWEASAIGDSFLFFVPKDCNNYKNDLIKLSSKPEPIEFDNFPDYLSSIGEIHKGKIEILRNQKLVDGTFFLMTDALAEWFINEGENAIGKITVWNSQTDFQRFITQAIDDNLLTNDDCAILCIELSDVEKNGIEYNKDKVTDLNDLILNQEAEKEKIGQKKQEERARYEGEAEIPNANDLESIKSSSINSKLNEQEPNEEETTNENLHTSRVKAVKDFIEENKKSDSSQLLFEQNTNSEIKLGEKLNSKQFELANEEPSHSETIMAEKQYPENDVNEELKREKIEVDAKSEKIKPEKLGPKEQSMVYLKAKNIFDKF
jgi:hypothetical protein